MARNKYTADYRLVEHFDEKGRVKVSYEYIGEPYRFTEPEETVRREKKICLSAAIAGWILFLAALIPYSEAMHRLWIALPFAASAVPLFLLTELICVVFRAKEPLERRIHDQLENLYPARLAIFSMFRLPFRIVQCPSVCGCALSFPPPEMAENRPFYLIFKPL